MDESATEERTEERLEVAVDNTPLHDTLSSLLRNEVDKKFLRGIFDGVENTASQINERADVFKSFLQRQHPNFEALKLKLQKKALKAALEEFRQTEAFLARLEEEKENLSPAARARLEDKSTIFDSKLSAKKRALELDDFLNGEGKSYTSLKKSAKIGALGNIFHTTLGRYVFSPLHRYIGQPIMSISETQAKQRGPFWKMVGLGALAVLGAAAVVGSGGLLIGAIAGGWGWGLSGVIAFGLGTWKVAENIPEAYQNWKAVRTSALSEQQTRDEAFAVKNDAYRDGYTPEVKALELSPSLIRMKGFNESDFQGRAGSLDVATGRFLMSKQMFLKYNGAADIAFNRSTGELLIALKNTDGQTAEQNAAMIEDIVLAATGRDVGESVVLGQSCDSLQAMTKVLKENAETVLLNNRLADLEKGLTPEILSKIVAKALVTPNPSEVGERGHPQIPGIAAAVMEVSSKNSEVYTGFIERATPILNNTISQLTGKKFNNTTDGNIEQITNAIMANAIPNYLKLDDAERKLALVKVLADSTDPATVTAAAIAASRFITKEQFARIKDTAVAWANDPQDEKSNISNFTAHILRDLKIAASGSGKGLQQKVESLHASAEEILTSTFSGSDKIEVGAWTLIRQTQAAAVIA